MSSTKIHKINKNRLKEYDGEIYDDKVTTLLNIVEDEMPIIEIDNSPISSIYLKEETLDRIESYRLTEGESIENILMRMILLSKTINNITD